MAWERLLVWLGVEGLWWEGLHMLPRIQRVERLWREGIHTIPGIHRVGAVAGGDSYGS